MHVTSSLLSAVEIEARKGTVVVVRVLRGASGNNAVVTVRDGKSFPPIADRKISEHLLKAVRELIVSGGVTELVDSVDEEGSPVRLAIEVVRPKLSLLIFGAGHVGQAVALIAAIIGYDVTVVDDREEFASRTRLPDPRIRLLVSDYAYAIEKLNISPSTAVVIVTRGHQYDEVCLKSVIHSNVAYLGMIGSRRRVLSVFKKLAGEGFSERDLERVHAPIGLRIGATSPQEIAVSILAEIIGQTKNADRQHKGEGNGI